MLGRSPARRLAQFRAFIVAGRAFLLVPGFVIPVFRMVFVDEILVGGQIDWLPPCFSAWR